MKRFLNSPRGGERAAASRSTSPPSAEGGVPRARGVHRSNSNRRALTVEPDVQDAFDILKRETPAGDRISVDDLGELIYLVVRQTFGAERRAAMLRIVDPVHQIEELDVLQCQFILNKIQASARASELAASASRPGSSKRPAKAGEAESEECCTCTTSDGSLGLGAVYAGC